MNFNRKDNFKIWLMKEVDRGKMDLKTGFALAVMRTPQTEAVVDENVRYTYEQWAQRVYSLANSLRHLGLKKGDRVLLGLRNREETVTTMMAILVSGGVAVPYNPRSSSETVAYFLRSSGATGVFFDDFSQNALCSVLTEFPNCKIRVAIIDDKTKVEITGASLFEELINSGNPEEPELTIDGKDPSFLFWTSGTTSLPKGVMVTHEQSIARVLFLATNHGLMYNDEHRIFGLMPLFHTVGTYSCWLTAVFYNGTYFPIQDFIPENVITLVEKEKISHIFGSPTHFYMILNSPSFSSDKMKTIKHALYAGAPMATSMVKRVSEEISENLTHIYGSTETFNSGYYRRSGEKPQALLSGMGHCTQIIKFGGCPGELVQPGEEGELILSLRSPEAFSGYWNNPEETAKRCKNGWFFTGDSAIREHDGSWFVTGRVDDIILSGGENIHPEEIEEVLLKQPDIQDVAVVGAQDEKWGQVVKAFIVTRSSELKEKELDEFLLQSTLDAWKRPKIYQFIDAIPRNPSGKVLRRVLMNLP